MPGKRKLRIATKEPFGQRLVRLRKAAGYSQRELGDELGISKRMVAYYEGETEHPPTTLLPLLSQVLGVTADELLGLEPMRKDAGTRDQRLWRRFKQLDRLSPTERRQVTQVIDAFLERSRLKERVAV